MYTCIIAYFVQSLCALWIVYPFFGIFFGGWLFLRVIFRVLPARLRRRFCRENERRPHSDSRADLHRVFL